MWLRIISLALVCTRVAVHGRSTGAPSSACTSMNPQHSSNTGQSGSAPFEILVSNTSYTANQVLTVTLKTKSGNTDKFKGFLVQGWKADATTGDAIGSFAVANGLVQSVCNGTTGNGMTHKSSGPKDNVVLQWTAPSAAQGHLQFRATFVSDFSTFWVQESSDYITDPTAPAMSSTTAAPSQTPITAIDTSECGASKGCYREPKGCNADSCQYLVTWKSDNDYVDFEVSSVTEGYIAVGFSLDKKMGNDAVTECVYIANNKRVEIRNSYNIPNGKSNEVVTGVAADTLTGKDAFYSNGKVQCRFKQKKTVFHSKVFNLTRQYFVLMARGKADNLGNKARHSLEANKYPLISPQEVNFNVNDDLDGVSKSPLVKIHGCLMLLGWMFSASLGIILARFYKPMWPNDKLCGQKIWFAIHRACMVTALVCTVVGFILIFIFAGGYSQLPGLPYWHFLHPIFGIIVTVLCILNPIMALFRPHPGTANRPIFNWAHWGVGTLAHICAIFAVMIGLNLAKAGVPWWATWIMVAFILFHVIVEVMLEVHNCLMSRRNKDKKEQFEMQRKNNPQLADIEPEPVGRRFKNVLLGIYLTVSIILNLVMILVIATA